MTLDLIILKCMLTPLAYFLWSFSISWIFLKIDKTYISCKIKNQWT